MPVPAAARAGLAAALLAGGLAAAPANASSSWSETMRTLCNISDGPAEEPVDAPPYGTSPCTGVRPGAQIQTAHGPCSMGFLFHGSDGRKYISTAGHCVLGTEVGEKTWTGATGSVANDAGGKRIGVAVYAVHRPIPAPSNGVTDFALIRLDRGVVADPQMCHFGGPTALETSDDADLMVFQHVGTGIAGLRSRSAVAPEGLYRPDYVYAHGVASFGDSGGALMREGGGAVGLVTQLAAGPLGNIGINRLAPHLARAGKLLGTTLTLQTAPLL